MNEYQRIVEYARVEALSNGHEYISPETLLLGILSFTNRATDTLYGLNVQLENLRRKIRRSIHGFLPSFSTKLDFNPSARRIIDLAEMLADREKTIAQAHHILLAILEDDRTTAGNCLLMENVTPDEVRKQLYGKNKDPLRARVDKLETRIEQLEGLAQQKGWVTGSATWPDEVVAELRRALGEQGYNNDTTRKGSTMKIERRTIGKMSIEDFADKHELVMEIGERGADFCSDDRFYASFKHCDVSNGAILHGDYGNGPTEEDAIADYAARISGKTLVFNAYKDNRMEIKAPWLTYDKK